MITIVIQNERRKIVRDGVCPPPDHAAGHKTGEEDSRVEGRITLHQRRHVFEEPFAHKKRDVFPVQVYNVRRRVGGGLDKNPFGVLVLFAVRELHRVEGMPRGVIVADERAESLDLRRRPPCGEHEVP